MKQHISTPCSQCPFREDCHDGWLGAARATEIAEAESFVCHKTTQGPLGARKQCAGHMVLTGTRNLFVRVAMADNYELNLNGAGVFSSKEAFIAHHKNNTDDDL